MKLSKRLLAVIMTVIMLVSYTIPAFASKENEPATVSSDELIDIRSGFVKFEELDKSYYYGTTDPNLFIGISVPESTDVTSLTPVKFTTFRAEGIPSVMYDTGKTPEEAGKSWRVEPLHEGAADYSQRPCWRFYLPGTGQYVDVPVIITEEVTDSIETIDKLGAYEERADELISTMRELESFYELLKDSSAQDNEKAGAYHPSNLDLVVEIARLLQTEFEINLGYFENHGYSIESGAWKKMTKADLITFWTTYESRTHQISCKEGDKLTQAKVDELDFWLKDIVPYWQERLEASRISEPVITAFAVGTSYGMIDAEKKLITIRRPAGADWSGAEPEIITAGDALVKRTNGSLTGSSAIYEVTSWEPLTGTVYDVSMKWRVNIEEGSPYNYVRSFSVETPDGKVRYAKITEGTDGVNGTIELNLPTGTVSGLNGLIPSVEIAGEGYYFTVDGTRVEAGRSIDFNKQVTLTVYNEEYELETTYTVSVTNAASAECDILSYELDGAIGTIDGTNIDITIPYATDLNTAVPKIGYSEFAKVAAPSSLVVGENTYKVTAQDGETVKTYTVNIQRTAISNACDMLSFKYGSYTADINNTTGKITLTVPQGVSLEFAPQIKVSPFATVSPAIGTVQDFSEPVTYKVTAQNTNRSKNYTVTVKVSAEQAENPYKEDMQALVDKIIERYRTEATDDWEWMDLGFYDNKLQNTDDGFYPGDAISTLNTQQAVGMTELGRTIMMLTARGFDCSNLAQYNSGNPYYDRNNNPVDNLAASLYNYDGTYTINGPAFALTALDMGNYTIPEDAKWTREALLDELLKHSLLSDGFGIDMVAAVIFAIAPYQNDPVYGSQVKDRLAEGLSLIRNNMSEDFTFSAWGEVNSESASWIILALNSMGVDCHVDPRFSDGQGKSVLSVWLEMFANYEEGYFHHTDALKNNYMATYEGCYASMWYLEFLKGGGQGHPCYFWYHRFDFSEPLSAEADILSFELEGKEGVIAENTITVELPKGTPLTSMAPEITLSEGAKLIDPELPTRFIEGVAKPFTVLAEDGTTQKTYYVTITFSDTLQSSGTEIYVDTIELQDSYQRELEILNKTVTNTNNGTDIVLHVDAGKNVKPLRIQAEISYGATVTPSLDGSYTMDLSNWMEFVVKSQDGQSKVYRIKVEAKGMASIEAFSLTIAGKTYNGVIDNEKNTITVSGVDDSKLTSTRLAPDITLSSGTTVCSPLSGIEQDFSQTVNYIVSGTNIASRTYLVDVYNQSGQRIRVSSDGGNENETPVAATAKISGFSVLGVEGVIDQNAGTITVTVPEGTNVTAVRPRVTVPSGATVSPVEGEVVNLTTPVTYTVTLGDAQKSYVVSVIYERSISQQLWENVTEHTTIKDHQVSYDPSGLPGGWRP